MLLLLLLLLLCVLLYCCYFVAAAARYRVPDDKICCCPLNLIPVLSFSSFKQSFSYFKQCLFLVYPLAVLSHLRPRFAYILGSYGHAWAREAKAAPL